VFPRGYVQNKNIKELQFVATVDKGVYSGPATVIIDGKKVCQTFFHDQVELVTANNHPVGRSNHITTDFAALNCLLNLVALIFVCLSLSEIAKEESIHTKLFFTIGLVFYILQLIETAFSQTFRLLWKSRSIQDYHLFRHFLTELRKCRPVVKLVYRPEWAQKKKVRGRNVVSPLCGDEEQEMLNYGLWADMSSEQAEFGKAMDYLSQFELTKINLFALFDFSTVANN
jgi:hypothetical protein